MSVEPKVAIVAGDVVWLVEFGPENAIRGVVDRVGEREVEVTHEEDGGGFDFWPLDSISKINPNEGS